MKLRIATFNLENLGAKPHHSGEAAPLEARIAVLRPQLLRLDADVLCLQEINGEKAASGYTLTALDALLAGTPYADYARLATERAPGKGPLDVHNLAILSRFPVTSQRQLRHEIVPPPAYRSVTAEPPAREAEAVTWERPLLQATLGLPEDRALHVLNLHLRAPLAAYVPGQKVSAFAWKSVAGWAEGFFLAAVKRAGQALEARLAVDALLDADEEAMIAVCGDCNAEARETAMRLLAGAEEDTGSGALAGRVLIAAENSIPEDLRFTVLHNGRKVMLDHLLASRALMAWYRGAEIHNEALGDELVAYANIGLSPESYHAPVVASFELPD
ncbi:MAG TPA: endonuclease/exonuclease/phosphatase family protein [Alphaproteobacteria bacterium]|nr:endonuclease/exonuclease/phosphatase family protein [Alphaproteobacteria bacterium]